MMAEPGVSIAGTGKIVVAAFPPKYFDHASLRLAFDGAKNFSVDDAGARKLKARANAPLDYVKQLQSDLIQLGYLESGTDDGIFSAKVRRAVERFQRHAKRVYRMPDKKDVAKDAVFAGKVTGICEQTTAREIRSWIAAGFVNPVGRFVTRTLDVAGATKKKLREDAADEWEAAVKLVGEQGGVLTGESNGYGDTQRTLQKKVAANKPGASSFSFHFCARAVDIDQGFGGGKGKRYFIQREDVGAKTFWRLFCKTELQDGTQGTSFTKGQVTCTDISTRTTYPIPKGSYIDMTSVIESRGTFQRIAAQTGFEDAALPAGVRYNKTEWWHFQYTVDIQETFLDELELIGITEKEARAGGWSTDAELDHKPG
jgi:hypothetical protein